MTALLDKLSSFTTVWKSLLEQQRMAGTPTLV